MLSQGGIRASGQRARAMRIAFKLPFTRKICDVLAPSNVTINTCCSMLNLLGNVQNIKCGYNYRLSNVPGNTHFTGPTPIFNLPVFV